MDVSKFKKTFYLNSFDMKNHRGIVACVIYLTTTTNLWSTTTGQILEAKKAGAKLPIPLADASAVFDGEDSVFIFGGYKLHKHIYAVNRSPLSPNVFEFLGTYSKYYESYILFW
jgi:hypothetical protein